MDGEADRYDALKLENQVCFPLYACTKELVRQYGPYLKELNLTYTQYIVMMVLWERERVSSRELAECLHLDYGTLTPVLKRLDQAGYLTRERAAEDERLLSQGFGMYITEENVDELITKFMQRKERFDEILKSNEKYFIDSIKKSFDLINLIPEEIKNIIVNKLNE